MMNNSNLSSTENEHLERLKSIFKQVGWETYTYKEFKQSEPYIQKGMYLFLNLENKTIGYVDLKIYKRINSQTCMRVEKLIQSEKILFYVLFTSTDVYILSKNQNLRRINRIPTPRNYKTLIKNVSPKSAKKKCKVCGALGLKDSVKCSPDESEIVLRPELKPNNEACFAELLKSVNILNDSINNNVLPRQKEMLNKQDEMLNNQLHIMSSLEEISKQINNISISIKDYQSLIVNALGKIDDNKYREIILSSFSDTLIEKITKSFQIDSQNDLFIKGEKELKKIFGGTWQRLDGSTRKYLLSAKVMLKEQQKIGDLVDYSGVCLLLTKSLEVELDKRFYSMFMDYLKTNYYSAGDYKNYPISMLERNKKKPIQRNHFTLGNIAYVFCSQYDKNTKQIDLQNNKDKLIEFARTELFHDKSDDEIFRLLQGYGEEIEYIRINFRNPAAHTNELRLADASECMKQVVDEEKFLKTMIDSFDK